MRDMVLVVGFPESNSLSIARKLRGEGIYTEVASHKILLSEIEADKPYGIILAGGAKGIHDLQGFDKAILSSGIPILALGDIASALCIAFGGSVSPYAITQNAASVSYQKENVLFNDVYEGERIMKEVYALSLPDALMPITWASVQQLNYIKDAAPDESEPENINNKIEEGEPATQNIVIGFESNERPLWAIETQLEKNDVEGMQILLNFAKEICNCNPWWDKEAFLHQSIEAIREKTGDGIALCALSGGIDSSVSAMLGHQALGNRMQCVFIDTGFFREGEVSEVIGIFRDELGLNLKFIDAKDRFLSAISGIAGMSAKHDCVHDLLHTIIIEQAQQIPNAHVILQGTNYSDFLLGETQEALEKQKAAPDDIQPVLPVGVLFKEEVSEIGRSLSLPDAILSRQPFPGAGLAARIIGGVTQSKLSILRQAEYIFKSEIIESLGQKAPARYHALLADINDMEPTGITICLRAYQPIDNQFAVAARLPHDLLERVVNKILGHISGIAKVVYDLSPTKQYNQE